MTINMFEPEPETAAAIRRAAEYHAAGGHSGRALQAKCGEYAELNIGTWDYIGRKTYTAVGILCGSENYEGLVMVASQEPDLLKALQDAQERYPDTPAAEAFAAVRKDALRAGWLGDGGRRAYNTTTTKKEVTA